MNKQRMVRVAVAATVCLAAGVPGLWGWAQGGGALPADVWVHVRSDGGADTDGDGLWDDFEVGQGLDPQKVESYPDGIPDESRLAADGRTMWEVQEAGAPASPGSSGGGCGATGMESVLLLELLLRLRRVRPRGRAFP